MIGFFNTESFKIQVSTPCLHMNDLWKCFQVLTVGNVAVISRRLDETAKTEFTEVIMSAH